MQELSQFGDERDFYCREFAPEQTAEFLEHYAAVFGDAFNPYMASSWQESPLSERGKRTRENRMGLAAAIARVCIEGDRVGLDIRPFQWMERFIDGSVDRDVEKVSAARDLFHLLCLRLIGKTVRRWRDYDEESADESASHNAAVQLFENLAEAAPSLRLLSEPGDDSKTYDRHEFLRDFENWRAIWSRLKHRFTPSLAEELGQLLNSAVGHLRRLSPYGKNRDHVFPAQDSSALIADICRVVSALQWEIGENVVPPLQQDVQETPLVDHGSHSKAAHHAHHLKLFPKGDINDAELMAAIIELDAKRAHGRTDMDILRAYTGESKGNAPRAESLPGRIRKARQDGRTTLPPRNKCAPCAP